MVGFFCAAVSGSRGRRGNSRYFELPVGCVCHPRLRRGPWATILISGVLPRDWPVSRLAKPEVGLALSGTERI